jgi:hypothetical protein
VRVTGPAHRDRACIMCAVNAGSCRRYYSEHNMYPAGLNRANLHRAGFLGATGG